MADTATAIIGTPAWVDLATTNRRPPARSTRGCSAGTSRSARIRSTVDTASRRSAIRTRPGSADAVARPAGGVVAVRRLGRPRGAPRRVTAAGGAVVAPPFDVGDQGRMAVFTDASGAFISAWQGTQMGGFQTTGANAFGWAELNARGVDAAVPFYREVFGWTAKDVGSPEQPYTEFQVDGRRSRARPRCRRWCRPRCRTRLLRGRRRRCDPSSAVDTGGGELVAPLDFPGGRMSIVRDPQGAAFGLMRLAAG